MNRIEVTELLLPGEAEVVDYDDLIREHNDAVIATLREADDE